jgi:hypothetical protein
MHDVVVPALFRWARFRVPVGAVPGSRLAPGAATRANGGRGFAVLKTWKVFTCFRGCPRRVGAFARAVLTLKHALHE